jgi:uncharacterized LabA/DUF88 family protein
MPAWQEVKSNTLKKTFAYVDGYNLYYGMMDRNNHDPTSTAIPALCKYLWLDLHGYISSYLPLEYSLQRIHYFTAAALGNEAALARHKRYWKALESNRGVQIHLGKHAPAGDRYSEKQTDVKFALQLYEDALFRTPDCAVLVCADSDQVPALQEIRKLGQSIELRAIFPPARYSDDLRKHADIRHRSDNERLREWQFPDEVGYTRAGHLIRVSRPLEWT